MGDRGTVRVSATVGGRLVEVELAVVDCVRPYTDGSAVRVAADRDASEALGAVPLVELLSPGTAVTAQVDAETRGRVAAHHSGTLVITSVRWRAMR